ncbi:hypothetical protein HK101_003886 [Irineochytrium annulatum]|nr:hypothetical protein HK101_003886 [Irineochytrium annulatum]
MANAKKNTEAYTEVVLTGRIAAAAVAFEAFIAAAVAMADEADVVVIAVIEYWRLQFTFARRAASTPPAASDQVSHPEGLEDDLGGLDGAADAQDLRTKEADGLMIAPTDLAAVDDLGRKLMTLRRTALTAEDIEPEASLDRALDLEKRKELLGPPSSKLVPTSVPIATSAEPVPAVVAAAQASLKNPSSSPWVVRPALGSSGRAKMHGSIPGALKNVVTSETAPTSPPSIRSAATHSTVLPKGSGLGIPSPSGPLQAATRPSLTHITASADPTAVPAVSPRGSSTFIMSADPLPSLPGKGRLVVVRPAPPTTQQADARPPAVPPTANATAMTTSTAMIEGQSAPVRLHIDDVNRRWNEMMLLEEVTEGVAYDLIDGGKSGVAVKVKPEVASGGLSLECKSSSPKKARRKEVGFEKKRITFSEKVMCRSISIVTLEQPQQNVMVMLPDGGFSEEVTSEFWSDEEQEDDDDEGHHDEIEEARSMRVAIRDEEIMMLGVDDEEATVGDSEFKRGGRPTKARGVRQHQPQSEVEQRHEEEEDEDDGEGFFNIEDDVDEEVEYMIEQSLRRDNPLPQKNDRALDRASHAPPAEVASVTLSAVAPSAKNIVEVADEGSLSGFDMPVLSRHPQEDSAIEIYPSSTDKKAGSRDVSPRDSPPYPLPPRPSNDPTLSSTFAEAVYGHSKHQESVSDIDLNEDFVTSLLPPPVLSASSQHQPTLRRTQNFVPIMPPTVLISPPLVREVPPAPPQPPLQLQQPHRRSPPSVPTLAGISPPRSSKVVEAASRPVPQLPHPPKVSSQPSMSLQYNRPQHPGRLHHHHQNHVASPTMARKSPPVAGTTTTDPVTPFSIASPASINVLIADQATGPAQPPAHAAPTAPPAQQQQRRGPSITAPMVVMRGHPHSAPLRNASRGQQAQWDDEDDDDQPAYESWSKGGDRDRGSPPHRSTQSNSDLRQATLGIEKGILPSGFRDDTLVAQRVQQQTPPHPRSAPPSAVDFLRTYMKPAADAADDWGRPATPPLEFDDAEFERPVLQPRPSTTTMEGDEDETDDQPSSRATPTKMIATARPVVVVVAPAARAGADGAWATPTRSKAELASKRDEDGMAELPQWAETGAAPTHGGFIAARRAKAQRKQQHNAQSEQSQLVESALATGDASIQTGEVPVVVIKMSPPPAERARRESGGANPASTASTEIGRLAEEMAAVGRRTAGEAGLQTSPRQVRHQLPTPPEEEEAGPNERETHRDGSIAIDKSPSRFFGTDGYDDDEDAPSLASTAQPRAPPPTRERNRRRKPHRGGGNSGGGGGAAHGNKLALFVAAAAAALSASASATAAEDEPEVEAAPAATAVAAPDSTTAATVAGSEGRPITAPASTSPRETPPATPQRLSYFRGLVGGAGASPMSARRSGSSILARSPLGRSTEVLLDVAEGGSSVGGGPGSDVAVTADGRADDVPDGEVEALGSVSGDAQSALRRGCSMEGRAPRGAVVGRSGGSDGADSFTVDDVTGAEVGAGGDVEVRTRKAKGLQQFWGRMVEKIKRVFRRRGSEVGIVPI